MTTTLLLKFVPDQQWLGFKQKTLAPGVRNIYQSKVPKGVKGIAWANRVPHNGNRLKGHPNVFVTGEYTTVGIGFASNGFIVGWDGPRRYQLTLKDALEFYIKFEQTQCTDAIYQYYGGYSDEKQLEKFLRAIMEHLP